mmetsp:Transcript_5710/g.7692  ORF Transcript_5710/g.7692 Transcript_5710/m.7692 type:complete len:86 (+) Transcript_5710:403-660(+)
MKLITQRSKRTTDLANRSRQRVQTWLSTLGEPKQVLNCIDDTEKPLKSMINTHSFRDEHEQRHISPHKFHVRLKYLTPAERLARA